MDSIETRRLAEILATSPIWARLALTAQDPVLRERAADTMAALIVDRLERTGPVHDARQIPLPIP